MIHMVISGGIFAVNWYMKATDEQRTRIHGTSLKMLDAVGRATRYQPVRDEASRRGLDLEASMARVETSPEAQQQLLDIFEAVAAESAVQQSQSARKRWSSFKAETSSFFA